MNPVRTIDTALIGLDGVNRNFLRILEMKEGRAGATLWAGVPRRVWPTAAAWR